MTDNESETGRTDLENHQFSLRSLFVATTVIASLVALSLDSNELLRTIAGTTLAINLFGWLAGLFITHGLGFPRDGSYRHKPDNSNRK